ncbi:MAG: hypothetical protein Q7R96_05085 [Nanoarchaeota archaeon]|nr:hypothetical protein [Nanoarchaeota archaeon]
MANHDITDIIARLRAYAGRTEKEDITRMPDQELFPANIIEKRIQELAQQDKAQAEAHADLLTQTTAANPAESVIGMLRDPTYIFGKIHRYEAQIGQLTDILDRLDQEGVQDKETITYLTNKRTGLIERLAQERNQNIFFPTICERFESKELLERYRAYIETALKLGPEEERIAATAAFITACKTDLTQRYGTVDLGKVLEKMELMASDSAWTLPPTIEETKTPYTTFKRLLSPTATKRLRTLGIKENQPMHALNVWKKFAVPKQCAAQFEQAINDLTNTQMVLDHEGKVFDLCGAYAERFWPDYQKLPEDVATAFEAQGTNTTQLQENYEKGETIIYSIYFHAGVQEKERPALEALVKTQPL